MGGVARGHSKHLYAAVDQRPASRLVILPLASPSSRLFTALRCAKAATSSRLVLIDTTEVEWQRARCRAKARRLMPADPVLVGFTTLQ